MTVDEICRAVFGRVGDRQRNTVRVNLHRLDSKGLIEKTAMRYSFKPGAKDA